jgi:hypothetical protein
VGHRGEEKDAFWVLGGKPEGQNHLEDVGMREDNVKMGPEEIGQEHMDLINWIQNKDRQWAVVKMVMNL